MSHDKNVRILSAQEVEEIMALPDRRFIIAGLERKGKFNENTGIFYILNDDGTLNGRIAKTTRKDRPPDEATLSMEMVMPSLNLSKLLVTQIFNIPAIRPATVNSFIL